MQVAKTFMGGKELLQYLENDTADILLLDVFMPDLDGINTLNEINHNSKYHRPKKNRHLNRIQHGITDDQNFRIGCRLLHRKTD